MSLIELDAVDAGYGENQVLHDLSVTVSEDRVNCIIGPNGSGKSTMLKSIFGMVDVWNGTVTIRGEDVTNDHPRGTRTGVVMLPQGKRLSGHERQGEPPDGCLPHRR